MLPGKLLVATNNEYVGTVSPPSPMFEPHRHRRGTDACPRFVSMRATTDRSLLVRPVECVAMQINPWFWYVLVCVCVCHVCVCVCVRLGGMVGVVVSSRYIVLKEDQTAGQRVLG